ncbi:MAG: metallophosphoesterase family protein [Candidatus Binatia bacterium]|nr:metallophosphoesterase family protein [Candidatus Binatia bacterium]
MSSSRLPILRSALAGLVLLVAVTAADAALTRGPYLQQATSSGIILRWRTDVAENSRVGYGTTIGAPDFTQDNATVTTEHQVTLTGLDASTTYYYEIGSTTTLLAGGDATHYFKTPPPTGTAVPTRIWAIGDSGYPEPAIIAPGWERDGDAVRDAYTAFNGGSATADIWLLLGDNAYTLATDVDYQTSLFEQYPEFLKTVAPWTCLGNHEGFSSNGLTQTGPYFDNFTLPTGGEAGGIASGTEAYYAFDYGSIHFVVLDAEDSILNRSRTNAMKAWLEADLASTNADWLIAFWHQPPYTKALFHDSDVELNEVNIREEALPILDDYGVDLVLTGHSHNYERSYQIDGHYGLSTTFGPEHVVDGGTGDPLVDHAYEKTNRGQVPHQGAVYVVAGSASEKRPNDAVVDYPHPVMAVAMSELGSLIVDVDGQTAVTTFLDSTGTVLDTFTINKGTSCPETPTAGCTNVIEAKLLMRQGTTDAKDKLVWRARDANIDPGDFGDPTSPSDAQIDVCMYDANGYLLGGGLTPGDANWKALGHVGFRYKDKASLPFGVGRAKFKVTGIPTGLILATGKGRQLRLPTLPLTPPVVAQAKNDVTGSCWETTFTAGDIVKNDSVRFLAK